MFIIFNWTINQTCVCYFNYIKKIFQFFVINLPNICSTFETPTFVAGPKNVIYHCFVVRRLSTSLVVFVALSFTLLLLIELFIVDFTKSGKPFSSMASKPNLSAGLEPVDSHTEKSCVASNYRQFSTNIKIKS